MHPNLWYPYTQAKTAPEPIEIKSAQGLWLELADGRKIADCISSWWVNLHGHAHPQIVKAIARQAAQLEQVIFAGFTEFERRWGRWIHGIRELPLLGHGYG